MKRKLLLSAIFAAGAVGAPAVAGDMQVLNEEELEEVSAQGFQQVVNDTRDWGGSGNQNNNLDSVQMNSTAQLNARAADLVAAATSSVNAAINILWSDATPPDPETVEPVTATGELVPPVVLPGPGNPQPYGESYDQENDQTAKNHMNTADGSESAEAFNSDKETQDIMNNIYGTWTTDSSTGSSVFNGSTVAGQDNNNNSVQLNDSAQQNVTGIFVENSAQSASNSGLNVFAGSVAYISGTQENEQEAYNMDNSAYSEGNASAYNGEGASATQTVNNSSPTDDNGPVTAEIYVVDQDNNNNSVQLNDSAQQNATAITLNNNANSAKNFGLNLHASLGALSNATDDDGNIIASPELSQENDQEAYNHNNEADGDVASAKNYNKEMQTVVNGLDQPSDKVNIQAQDNNNNSVQLNDTAQQNAAGLEIRNSAVSAYNTGVNLMVFESADSASLDQENHQTAENMNNSAYGSSKADALNGEWDDETNVPTQFVQTNSNVMDQDNNNNSVQLNNAAQENAAALAIVNNANSSQNSGLNIIVDLITSGGSTGGGSTDPSLKGISGTHVDQENEQHAYNHYNYADATEGDAYAGNINKQSQEVINSDAVDGTEVQVDIVDNSNNNNSVQLNDTAQKNAKALEITNMAVSAANTGFNIAIFHSVTDSEIDQENDQTASNFENEAYGTASATAVNGEFSENPGQHIRNVHARINGQDNNNNSVQLNDNAQENAQGLSIANIAKVALNSAFNVIWVENSVSGADIEQENHQYAYNHNNYAEGGVALAMNNTKQNQLIENCYCADIVDQNNNQNSVQVNDAAQANLRGWHVLNGATSAINMATNFMATKGAVSGTTLTQENHQHAVNFSNTAWGTSATAGNLK